MTPQILSCGCLLRIVSRRTLVIEGQTHCCPHLMPRSTDRRSGRRHQSQPRCARHSQRCSRRRSRAVAAAPRGQALVAVRALALAPDAGACVDSAPCAQGDAAPGSRVFAALEKKKPRRSGASCIRITCQLCLRRRAKPIAARPRPSSASVPGSGVRFGGSVELLNEALICVPGPWFCV